MIRSLLNSLRKTLDDVLNTTVIFGYDRMGYHLRQPLWDPADTAVSLKGKVCLITGANSGLGYATALALAEREATVIMVCRNQERGRQALQAIAQATGNSDLHLELIDMSELESIENGCQRILERFQRLDILVNNAGVLLNQREETAAGFEKSFATNLLGPYLLTTRLQPLLQQTAQTSSTEHPRVIMVVSGGLYFGKVHPEDLHFSERDYNGSMAYAEAKRGQMLLTQLWAKAWAGSGILVNAMHPGWADTPGIESSLPGFHQLTKLILRDQAQGADTIVWLACKPNLHQSGQLFFDRKARAQHRSAKTRNSLSEIESFWHYLGQVSQAPEPFPFLLNTNQTGAQS